jgi:hypothetical protein
MNRRLTHITIRAFGKAANKACLAATMKDPVQLARAVNSMAVVLTNFATGLPLLECLHTLLVIGKLLQRQPLPSGLVP